MISCPFSSQAILGEHELRAALHGLNHCLRFAAIPFGLGLGARAALGGVGPVMALPSLSRHALAAAANANPTQTYV